MAEITETRYRMLHDRYGEASCDANMWERIAHDHENMNVSLRQTNADLRRIIVEKDAKADELISQCARLEAENAELRELLRSVVRAFGVRDE